MILQDIFDHFRGSLLQFITCAIRNVNSKVVIFIVNFWEEGGGGGGVMSRNSTPMNETLMSTSTAHVSSMRP